MPPEPSSSSSSPSPGKPTAALAFVVGWLTFRGLAWWSTGLGLLESPLLLSTPVGWTGRLHVLALARQLWVGTAGSLPPTLLILMMHATLYAYLLVYLRPELWTTLDLWTRTQVLIECSTAAGLALLLCVKRPLRWESDASN